MGAREFKFSDLPPDWKTTVISMMRDGAGKTEVIAEFGLSFYQHGVLCQEQEEYADAFALGDVFMKAWWEKEGRLNTRNKNFNVGVWAMNMRNRCGWMDKPLGADKDKPLLPDDAGEHEDVARFKKRGGAHEKDNAAAVN